MSDVVKEQLVKKSTNAKDMFLRVVIVVVALILCIVAVGLMQYLYNFFFFILAAIVFVVWLLFSRMRKEYEYIFVNGDLDVDCIYHRSSRRHVFSGDVKKIERMSPVDDRGTDNDFRGAKVRDCSSGVRGPNTYRFAASYKGKRLCVIFEPDEELLTKMTPYLGQRKLVKRK